MNRIIYNTEEVFFGSPEHEDGGPYLFITGYEVLKRLDKVQSVNYSFESPSSDINVLGSTTSIDTIHSAPPSANVSYSYYSHGISNEKKAGFYVQQQGTEKKNFFSNLVDKDTFSDRKNFYLASNQTPGQDLKNTLASMSALKFQGDSQDRDTLTDPRSENYDLFIFQNSYISSYQFDASVNSFATASVGMVSDNAIIITSGKWVSIPKFNAKSGIVEYDSNKIIIPKRTVLTSQEKDVGRVFRDHDISVLVNKRNTSGINYFNEKVQSVSFQAEIQRKPIIYLGHKHYHDRKPVFPIVGKLEISFLADIGVSGSLFETMDNSEYDVHLTFKDKDKEVLKYSFEGARCTDFSSSLSIGDNKQYNASFTLNMDLSENKKGFFVSGESEKVDFELVDDSSDKILDDSNNEIDYSNSLFY